MRLITIILVLTFSNFVEGQHSLNKMPYPVNTDVYDEICPILSFEENELYFTRVGSPDFNKTLVENGENLFETRAFERYQLRLQQVYGMITGSYVENPTSSSFNQDVWYSHYHEGQIFNLFHPGYPLNNSLPNSICSHFGREGAYVVINEFKKEGGIQAGFSTVDKIDDITFTFPEPLVIKDFNKTASEVNISMSPDREYIILAMDRSDSKGDKDLYLSIKGYQGVYSKPRHLGDVLNSPYREGTPFFSQDKSKLYFSSNRPGGIGGMDIYVSKRLDPSFKNWSEPVLLGQPVNSPFDDSHPYVQLDENSILFTSNRDGSSDIFHAKLVRDEELLYAIDINVYIVKGEERSPVTAQVYWAKAYSGEYDGFFRARGGRYTYTFNENVPLNFKAENRGLMSNIIMVDPQELQDAGIRELDIELYLESGKTRQPQLKRPKFTKKDTAIIVDSDLQDSTKAIQTDDLIPLEFNSTVVLKNIFFERAKPDVLPISFESLMKLANTVKRRTDVVIQVEGHTDNVGDSQALMDLSLSRANAIRDILINHGVKPNQVKTKGFGASRPITKNRNEEERSRNRRVEIRVLRQGE